MAEIITKTKVDDLDGTSENVERIKFAFRGKNYSIDLSEANQQAMEEALAPFLQKASELKSAGPTRRRATGGSGQDTAKIRTWAQENEITYLDVHGVERQVGDRGRIHASVIQRYNEAAA